MSPIRKFAFVNLALALVVVGVSGCQREEGPAERAGKKIDSSVGEAGRKVDDAVDTAGRKIERAGEKIQDAAQDAKK